MVGLADIGRVTRRVKLTTRPNGHAVEREIEVGGLPAKTIFRALDRFPELRRMLSAGQDSESIDLMQLVALIPDAVAMAIAAGCGADNDPEMERIASDLPLETQFDLLSAILDLTTPGGFGPFVERLKDLLVASGLAQRLPAQLDADQSALGRGTISPSELNS